MDELIYFETRLSGNHKDGAKKQGMKRRSFLKFMGSGVAVAILPAGTFELFRKAGPEDFLKKATDKEVGGWIHIGEDNTVTVFTGKVEVGQNIRTSLAQAVAEELGVGIDSIKMIMGDTALVPYDWGTAGSRSTPQMGMQLRQAAATAREILLEMAAKELKTDKNQLGVADGKVYVKKTKQNVTYGQLCKGKELLEAVSEEISLKTPDQWKIAGKSVPKVNGRDFLTGRHLYASDMSLPGMLHAKILRAPAYGAKLTSADTSEAESMEGVKVVRDTEFIGVAADKLWKAEKALASIKAKYNLKEQPSREEIFDYLKANAKSGENTRGKTEQGDFGKGMAAATKKLSETYTIDYIAHAPMEPRAALAQWEEGKLTVWTGTQMPFRVRDDLAERYKLSKENVRVIMPDTGSAYGGKHSGEAAIEAAKMAIALKKPVKLVWTREEEFTWAYFRPAGVIEARAGVDKDGTITAWEFYNYNSGPAAIDTPYNVGNKRIEFFPVDSPLKQGSYRGLASVANVFAIEALMNDLADLANMDPLEFRLKHLKEPRLINVYKAVADAFGWGKVRPQTNHGFGIGGGTDKGGYTASIAEVSVNPSDGEVKVIRMVTAFECGAIINPEHVESQVMGSIVQGMGGALFESVNFKDGKIINPKFSQYRVPRFQDTPKIEIIMLNRTDLPSAGAGEAPIVGIAPAIRNAIDNATGVKLAALPLVPKGLSLSMVNE